MSMSRPIPLCLLCAALLSSAHAQATEFHYSGELSDGGAPANGRYDLQLRFAASADGASFGEPLNVHAVEVRDGHFETQFDGPDGADALWLAVAVRKSGDTIFSALPGRDQALATPLVGTCWSSTGDPGTNPATHFLGTTDAQPLVLRTRNAQSLRIEPSTQTFGSPALPITRNMIGGSHANGVTAGVRGATIAGGGAPTGNSDPDLSDEAPNLVTDHYGSIGGGYGNRAGDVGGTLESASHATVAGGDGNLANGPRSAVGGGRSNQAAGELSTVAGGGGNQASGLSSAVGGGGINLASGAYGTVAGGLANVASGAASFVASGTNNCAGGSLSFAGGRSAKVRPGSASGTGCESVPSSGDANGDEGSFVWGGDLSEDFISTGPNQFLVRAQGGMAINTTIPMPGAALTVNGGVSVAQTGNLEFGSQTRQMLNLWGPAQYGIGVQADTLYQRSNSSFAWFQGGTHSNTTLAAGTGGNALMTLTPPGGPTTTVTGTARAQTFVSVSDRAMKTAFEAIDPAAVLRHVIEMPISTWSYRNAPALRHMGPVAQDFRAAFGLGEDDTSIATVDADGVALAAIQGLNRKLEAENAALRERLAAIEARLGRAAD